MYTRCPAAENGWWTDVGGMSGRMRISDHETYARQRSSCPPIISFV
jgi:hypothetical protein